MASKRGVGTGDRVALVGALTSLLSRDPTALESVRAQLVARRDAAAEVLAFELAGRLQNEIQAVEWLTCAQRVTLADPEDFEVYGWSSGILVRFQVRAGRVRTWTQRPRTAASAARLVAGTPDDWREFADRNAALAARLHG
jgi:excinuclease ABC subunit C